MNKYVAALFFLASTVIPASAGSVVTGEEHCVVHVADWDRLNIRSAPSSQGSIVARKRYGSCGIEVVGRCRNAWCPVEDGHVKGWANRRYLDMVSPALYCLRQGTQQKTRTLRAYPSFTSRALTTLGSSTCDIAFLPYARDGWQKIRSRGWEGWMKRQALSGE